MAYLKIVLTLSVLLTSCSSHSQDVPVHVNFAGHGWVFPSTVREAVSRYKLDYKSPYFYRKLMDSTALQVEFIYQSGDYDDENQTGEALYERPIRTYTLIYPYSTSRMDSLRSALSVVTGAEPVHYAITRDFGLDVISREIYSRVVPNKGFVDFDLFTGHDYVIGLRRHPPNKEGQNTPIEVFIMYGMTDARIRERMLAR